MRILNRALAIFVIGAFSGCAAEPAGGAAESLSGTVRLNGEPVEFAMIIVTGPDGKQANGPQLPGGRYLIEHPPTGQLRFKFAAGPPPEPGAAPPKTTRSSIPPVYFSDKNDLSFEYKGGKQTYDINLKS